MQRVSDQLAFDYEGMDFTRNATARLHAAESYIPETIREGRQMRQLLVHRRVLLHYSQQIDAALENRDHVRTVIWSLQQHIQRLSDPASPDIVRNGRGRTSFSFPAGSENHAITVEFVRESDGTYSFVIYNKGEGGADSDLHGSVGFMQGDKFIGRSRVQIKGLQKHHLQDPSFLDKLVRSQIEEERIYSLYETIKSHLLVQSGGFIRTSPLESEWLSLSRNFTPHARARKAEIERQLCRDPDFHTFQTAGTCTESNVQTAEHFILDPLLRKKLKLHSLFLTKERLGAAIYQVPELAAKVELKIAQLEHKIFSA